MARWCVVPARGPLIAISARTESRPSRSAPPGSEKPTVNIIDSRWVLTWKLIEGRPSQLYALSEDPSELRDRADENPDLVRELRERLERLVGEHSALDWREPQRVVVEAVDDAVVEGPRMQLSRKTTRTGWRRSSRPRL